MILPVEVNSLLHMFMLFVHIQLRHVAILSSGSFMPSLGLADMEGSDVHALIERAKQRARKVAEAEPAEPTKTQDELLKAKTLVFGYLWLTLNMNCFS